MHRLKKAPIAHLKVDKATTKVFSKYTDFTDIFSLKLAAEFPKPTGINDHTIELVDNQQLPYGSIYSLGQVELVTLKAYIKNNLANSFIKLFKFSTRAPIFFDKKLNKSLSFCKDYQGLNNLIIQNWYLLPLVRELLNRLGRAQYFT